MHGILGSAVGSLGHAVNYQIPLKNRRSDAFGKIDLVLLRDRELAFAEVKFGRNAETLLRSVLEVATYFQICDKDKLIEDFRSHGDLEIEGIRDSGVVLLVADKNGIRPRAWEDAQSAAMSPVLEVARKLNVRIVCVDDTGKVLYEPAIPQP